MKIYLLVPKKIWLQMKITTLFLILASFCLPANNSYSQNKKVSLDMQNSSITDIFREIENRTDYRFFYNKNHIDTEKRVSVNINEKEVSTILDKLLSSENVSYTMVNNYIVITPKESEKDSSGIDQDNRKTVIGSVTDWQGEPVIGANIIEKGTTNGTVTDMDGNFTLRVEDNSILYISYLGYLPQDVDTKGRTSFDIILQEDTKALDELIVIGYGSIKKSSLTSAVSKMDSRGIENRPLARAESALQGQLAGVTVRTTTGEPGADMQIRVRGAASVNASSDPLYVVDGIPMTTIAWLNPADIEAIEVLKDAAASAIYGSRGSNGVVIVSTKKGKSGKARVSVNVSYGVQSMEKRLDIMTAEEWMGFNVKAIDARYLRDAANRGITNAQISDDPETRLKNAGVWSSTANLNDRSTWPNNYYQYLNDPRWFKYLDPQIAAVHDYDVAAINTNDQLSLLDWQDEFYREALVRDVTLNVTGGTENTTYLFSGGVFTQDGIATGTTYNRYTARTNIESKINKYITTGILLSPTYIQRDNAGRANGKDSQAHLVISATPVSEPDVGYRTNVEPNPQYRWAGSGASPIVFMENIRHDDIFRMLGNAFVRVTPLDGLRIELSGSANYYDLDGQTYQFSRTGNTWAQGEGANSSGSHNTDRSWTTLLQGLVNYDKTFGKHTIGLMSGSSQEQIGVGYTTNQTYNKPFPNDAITGSFDGSKVTAGTNTVIQRTANKLVSFFGRAQYNFDELYLISASLRYDGGSVFGSNNKWGLFPSASAGWNIANESFFKSLDLHWINALKLRASYGATGNNAISNTAAYPTLASVNYAGFAGYNASSLGNSDLGWEKAHSTDLAIDLGLFNNRVQLSFDWYTKRTNDLLYQVPSLGASGFTTVWDNLGDIKNDGFEVELNTQNTVGELKWSTAFNLSYNRNEVLSLGVDDTPIYSGFDGNNPSNILTVGHPVNSFYMYEAIGVWKTQQEINEYASKMGVDKVTFETNEIKPGDLRYRDVNRDGTFDKNNDRVFLGSPTPKFTYGMTNNFTWKNFDLSVLITAQTGGKIFGVLGRAIDRPSMNPASNMMDVWLNSWWSEDEQGDGHTPYILSTTTGGNVDSRWLQSSDYLRIKNLTFGYKLPVSPKWISGLRTYVSIENLWKWDNYYNGYSTEAANSGQSGAPGGGGALGLDYASYPIARVFTFGFNIDF